MLSFKNGVTIRILSETVTNLTKPFPYERLAKSLFFKLKIKHFVIKSC